MIKTLYVILIPTILLALLVTLAIGISIGIKHERKKPSITTNIGTEVPKSMLNYDTQPRKTSVGSFHFPSYCIEGVLYWKLVTKYATNVTPAYYVKKDSTTERILCE